MSDIIGQIDNSVCDIIINKLSTYSDKDNKMLMFNDEETIFKVKIKDHPFIVKIGIVDDKYDKNPYFAKKLKVIKCDNKIFTFYEYVRYKLINALLIENNEWTQVKNQLIECMKIYKKTFNKDGYFTFENLLLDEDGNIKLVSFVNNPRVQTLKDVINETFIDLFSKFNFHDNIINYCGINPDFKNNYYKKIMSDMIDKNDNAWNSKVKTKVAIYTMYEWLRENDHVPNIVKLLNENNNFPYYYPKF